VPETPAIKTQAKRGRENEDLKNEDEANNLRIKLPLQLNDLTNVSDQFNDIMHKSWRFADKYCLECKIIEKARKCCIYQPFRRNFRQ
tara:strand:- start:7571 stop:7831 length:261 start_codon:yes stop_codon:yes gene_type:complete